MPPPWSGTTVGRARRRGPAAGKGWGLPPSAPIRNRIEFTSGRSFPTTAMTLRRLPETIIVLGILYCAGVAVYGATKFDLTSTLSSKTFLVGVSATLAAVLALALLLPRVARSNLALVLVSLGATILAVEVFFFVTDQTDQHGSPVVRRMMEAARDAGRPIDSRTRLEVVRDLRSHGVDAVPFTGFGDLTITNPDGHAVPIVGGVSMATTVYCNESGQYLIYDADEHGFNNPRGLYGRVPLQVALIGDSYTHGACVPNEASIANHIRTAFPRTLNLGASSAGPLSGLARFMEYAASLSPRFVVWHWFEGNELVDLQREFAQEPLRRYLTTDAPFGLKMRQDEIDQVSRVSINTEMQRVAINTEMQRSEHGEDVVAGILLLRSIRTRLAAAVATVLRLRRGEGGSEDELTTDELLAVSERILTIVRDAIRGWGGELVMVYLPDSIRYCDAVPAWREFCTKEVPQRRRWEVGPRDDLLEMFSRLSLPVVDGHAAFLSTGRSPNDFFYYAGSHYSPFGYRVIAEATLRELRLRLAASEPDSSTRSPGQQQQ